MRASEKETRKNNTTAYLYIVMVMGGEHSPFAVALAPTDVSGTAIRAAGKKGVGDMVMATVRKGKPELRKKGELQWDDGSERSLTAIAVGPRSVSCVTDAGTRPMITLALLSLLLMSNTALLSFLPYLDHTVAHSSVSPPNECNAMRTWRVLETLFTSLKIA